MSTINDNKNKRPVGRPATGKGQMIGLRLHDDLLTPLDTFITEHPENLSRPAAIRLLLREQLIELGMLKPDEEGSD